MSKIFEIEPTNIDMIKAPQIALIIEMNLPKGETAVTSP
jgi:hypothetical protein